jgi:hypothetical protein
METKGDFHGTIIDYRDEYHVARKMMGTKGTDLDELIKKVGLLYLNCPEDMQPHYLALINEIEQRQMMIDFPQMVTGLVSSR